MRQIALALALILGLANGAAAQAPPPVPALPDSTRLTSYNISTSTCACSVGFQIYGSGTDVDEWIQVYVNGIAYLSTDPTFGWSLSSVSGSLGSIPRPITNAVLTFNASQTATVVIVGDERPRRLSQFTENRGVTGRDLNQAVTDIIAVQRELWDKSNRSIVGQPGDSLLPLPSVAARAGQYLCFDSNGNPIPCQSASPGSVTLPNSSINGDSVCFAGTTGKSFSDCGWGITGAAPAGSVPLGRSGGGPAAWTQAPCIQIEAFGGSGNGSTDNTAAYNAAVTAQTGSNLICIQFGAGVYQFSSSVTVSLSAGKTMAWRGAGMDVTQLRFASATGATVNFAATSNSFHARDMAVTTQGVGTGSAITLVQTQATLPSPAAAAVSDFTNVVFRGADGYVVTDYWLFGVVIDRASNVSFLNTYFTGANPVSGGYTLVGTGVKISGTSVNNAPVQFVFTGCTFNYTGTGIEIGNWTQGVLVSNSNFTGGNAGIVSDTGLSGLSELTVVGSQFNQKFAGIWELTAIPGTLIIGNYFLPQPSNVGVQIEIAAFFTISGNVFQGASAGTGVVVLTTSGVLNGGVISGNSFVNLNTGVVLQANASNIKLRGNFYQGSTAVNVNNLRVAPSDTLLTANDLGDDYFTTYRALTICNSPTAGVTATVTDSTTNTWGANITTGAGSDIVRAVCNGTNWTVMGK